MRKFLVIVVMFITLIACQSKTAYMKDFDDFINDVRQECSDFNEKDWKKADKEFIELSEKKYKQYVEELSIEEKAQIMTLKGVYGALRVKAGLKDMGKELENAGKQVEGFLKELNKD